MIIGKMALCTVTCHGNILSLLIFQLYGGTLSIWGKPYIYNFCIEYSLSEIKLPFPSEKTEQQITLLFRWLLCCCDTIFCVQGVQSQKGLFVCCKSHPGSYLHFSICFLYINSSSDFEFFSQIAWHSWAHTLLFCFSAVQFWPYLNDKAINIKELQLLLSIIKFLYLIGNVVLRVFKLSAINQEWIWWFKLLKSKTILMLSYRLPQHFYLLMSMSLLAKFTRKAQLKKHEWIYGESLLTTTKSLYIEEKIFHHVVLLVEIFGALLPFLAEQSKADLQQSRETNEFCGLWLYQGTLPCCCPKQSPSLRVSHRCCKVFNCEVNSCWAATAYRWHLSFRWPCYCDQQTMAA